MDVTLGHQQLQKWVDTWALGRMTPFLRVKAFQASILSFLPFPPPFLPFTGQYRIGWDRDGNQH